MGYIANSKYGNCSRCPAKNVACRKRKKDLVCIPCCTKEDTQKQIDKAKSRDAARNIQSKLRSDNAHENKLLDNTAKREYERKEQWFSIVRKRLTGTCQCGCNKPSSKYDDKNFRSSCSHLFPKNRFKSIQYHPNNFVERNFWDGCHQNLDNQGMDKWPLMADWEVIKEKFHELAPLLTDQERANKFYTTLEKLIYPNRNNNLLTVK